MGVTNALGRNHYGFYESKKSLDGLAEPAEEPEGWLCLGSRRLGFSVNRMCPRQLRSVAETTFPFEVFAVWRQFRVGVLGEVKTFFVGDQAFVESCFARQLTHPDIPFAFLPCGWAMLWNLLFHEVRWFKQCLHKNCAAGEMG